MSPNKHLVSLYARHSNRSIDPVHCRHQFPDRPPRRACSEHCLEASIKVRSIRLNTQARCKEAPLPLEELLQGVQLCSEPEQAELPETELLLGFLHGEAETLVTVIDLVGSPGALHRF